MSYASKDTGVVFSGSSSLKYVFASGGAAGDWHGVSTNDPEAGAFCVALRPGSNYRLRMTARVSSLTSTPQWRVRLSHNVAESVTNSKTFTFAAVNTWETGEFSFYVPTTAEPNTKVYVEFKRGDTTGRNFWADGLRIVEQEIGQDHANTVGTGRFDSVFNGDFENGLQYWGSDNAGKVAIDTGTVYKGIKSLKVTGVTTGTDGTVAKQVNTPYDELLPIGDRLLLVRAQPADTRVRITTAIKVASTSGWTAGKEPALIVSFYDDVGAFLSTNGVASTLTGTAWEVVTYDVKVPAGAFYVNVGFRGKRASTESDFWVDEVHVTYPADGGALSAGTDRVLEAVSQPWSSAATTETLQHTFTVPANTLVASGDQIRITITGNQVAQTGFIRVKFGATYIYNVGNTATWAADCNWYLTVTLACIAQTSEVAVGYGINTNVVDRTDRATPGEDLKTAVDIKVYAKNTSGGTMNCDSILIERLLTP